MYVLSVSFLSRSEFVFKVVLRSFTIKKKKEVVLIKDIIHLYWPYPSVV